MQTTFEIPREPKPEDVKAVTDFCGIPWVRIPGVRGWQCLAKDVDPDQMEWRELLVNRGPLTPTTEEAARNAAEAQTA